LQRQLAAYKLLIIDQLGYVPLSTIGAELLFRVFSQRYEVGSNIVASNLPFTSVQRVRGPGDLTGALLDGLTHHIHILEMNGDSPGTIGNFVRRLGMIGAKEPDNAATQRTSHFRRRS
jgi:DNA replication protein DnaC